MPAYFVKTVRLWQDNCPLPSVESGISISKNPDFRFDFKPDGAKLIRAEIVDSRDAVFTAEWPAPAAGS